MKRAVVTTIALLVTACGGSSPTLKSGAPPTAQELCATRGLEKANAHGRNVRLIASFDSTAAEIAQWQENRAKKDAGLTPRSQFRNRPGATRFALCYYDADYFAMPSGGGGTPNRLALGVPLEGEVLVERSGPREKMDIAHP